MGLFGVTELFDPEAKVELMGVAVLHAPDERRALDLHLTTRSASCTSARGGSPPRS